MTTQSRPQARIDFELEMAEYYEAAGLDRQAERSRSIAAEIAEAAAYAERGAGPELGVPVSRDRPQPEPEPEAEI
jgi:hypothetical protein